jgi:hypothetical protein
MIQQEKIFLFSDGPQIAVERKVVHSREGCSASVVCNVFGKQFS